MIVDLDIDRDALTRRWRELAADPDAPDFYELSEFGELILTPRPTNDHQQVLQAVSRSIDRQLGPAAVQEISVLTDRGIRVPDVVWMPAERWRAAKGLTPLPFVPDLCVEVLSTGNTKQEIAMKIGAYLRGGAREVIVVGLHGEIEHHGAEGLLARSALGVTLDLPPELF